MPVRDKVIQGLRCHHIDKMHRINCADCPYYTEDDTMMSCLNKLHDDAVAVIQKQKAPYQSVKKLPCVCGRKNVETWTSWVDGKVAESFRCPKCGRKTGLYKTHMELVEAWNRMVTEDD